MEPPVRSEGALGRERGVLQLRPRGPRPHCLHRGEDDSIVLTTAGSGAIAAEAVPGQRLDGNVAGERGRLVGSVVGLREQAERRELLEERAHVLEPCVRAGHRGRERDPLDIPGAIRVPEHGPLTLPEHELAPLRV
ncbi:MAG: hypothetical protein M5U28_51335 [Sandaracinaceae bacterium]|nr:hypothetical protein [Sandaracinaceae bacterium]